MRAHDDRSQAAMTGRRLAVPGTMTCVVTLIWIKLALRVGGLGRTMRLSNALCATVRPRQCVETTVLTEIVRKVAVAGAFFPGRAYCLEQSLTLHHLLRRSGVDSVFRLGVQPYGFTAHAWVEYNGAPLNETGEITRGLAQLPLPTL